MSLSVPLSGVFPLLSSSSGSLSGVSPLLSSEDNLTISSVSLTLSLLANSSPSSDAIPTIDTLSPTAILAVHASSPVSTIPLLEDPTYPST